MIQTSKSTITAMKKYVFFWFQGLFSAKFGGWNCCLADLQTSGVQVVVALIFPLTLILFNSVPASVFRKDLFAILLNIFLVSGEILSRHKNIIRYVIMYIIVSHHTRVGSQI